MKNVFAITSNADRFLAAMKALEKRGASEASWVLLTGLPGLGKTELVEWWALRHDALYLRAKSAWTPRAAMAELAERLGIAPSKKSGELFGQIIGVLTVGLDLDLNLAVQVELCGMHGLGELLGLPREFGELGQSVLGRVGEGRRGPDAGDSRNTDDDTDKRLTGNEFDY